MMKNVLGAYLDAITRERDFDLPFLSLLMAMGFQDVHFTHGSAELGKDFIAKRVVSGATVQYSFQSKAGDINQSAWRNDIQGQLLEATISPRSHPNFDTSLQHQSVLVLTGRLTGNAPSCIPSFNETLARLEKLPLQVWDKTTLIEELAAYGLEGIHRTTVEGFQNYGHFYNLYGKSIQGRVSEQEIEEHSYHWTNEPNETARRILVATLEAEILATQCKQQKQYYQCIKSYLALLRAIMHALHTTNDSSEEETLTQLYSQAIQSIHREVKAYLEEFRQSWSKTPHGLFHMIDDSASIITYPIRCLRILELKGLLYFLENDQHAKEETADFIQAFIAKEAGCSHIVADRFAVSLVPPILALCQSGRHDVAQGLLHQATI